MGASASHNCPPQTEVPRGKIRICVSGYHYSEYAGRSQWLANHLATTYPDKFESWYYWAWMGPFFRYNINTFDKVPFPTPIKGHASSPMVWLEVNKADATGNSALPENAIDGNNAVLEVIGGNAEFQTWIKQHTAKADGTPFMAPPAAEAEPKVARAPATLYFKETPLLTSWWTGASPWADSIRRQNPPQTAAAVKAEVK
eukprot:GILK01017656.1.p1 GENE.GILK01017656.1~~GILK01017656.1.p1  ORF type:complete len:227 (+),score=9.47 GILK01017656.1:83-682(+)